MTAGLGGMWGLDPAGHRAPKVKGREKVKDALGFRPGQRRDGAGWGGWGGLVGSVEEEHSRGVGHVLWTRGTGEAGESWDVCRS